MIGSELAHYRVVAKLGEGGMGEVYQAKDARLGRDVAIKVLPAEVATDPDRLARFEREAKTLAALDHPNIVHIYSVESAETEDGPPVRFLTMQLVDGATLSKLIPDGGVELDRFFEVAIPMAAALAAAHEAGVVHRDLKPANVMVTGEGLVKVLDFGVAKHEREALEPVATELATEPLTREGAMLGTFPYMSPEQVEGKKLDARSDIFALGVVLHEMATGKRPFGGDSPVALLTSILKDTPGEVDRLRPELPHHLGRIIRRCLEKEPRRRYQAALDVRNELQDLERELEASRVLAQTAATADERDRVAASSATAGSSRRRWLAAAGVVSALAIVWAVWQGTRPATEVEATATSDSGPAAAVVATPSVAVLPFADMSADKDQQYFSDGLSEELLNLLSRTKGLKVAARTSSFSFRDREEVDVSTIAKALGVAHLLEGSVRKAGNQVKITAQLIDAGDGFHLWSRSFTRELDDIFAVQDEIARLVVGALQTTLLGELSQDSPSRSRSVEAYNLYLQGKFFAQRRLGSEDYERAVEHLERAVELDPEYALAWAGLAYAVNNQAVDGYADLEEGHDRAVAAVEKALELDESLAYAWAVLGEIRRELEWDWAGAGEALARARSLEPRNPDVIRRQAELALTLGEFDEAIALGRLATDRDPLNVLPYSVLASTFLDAGRLDEAEKALEKIQSLSPDYLNASAWSAAIELTRGRGEAALRHAEQLEGSSRLYYQALAYQLLGRGQEAKEILRQLIEAGDGEFLPTSIAEAFAFLGDTDPAFEWLERAYDQRDPMLIDVKTRTRLANLHADPRWEAFLRKMNLAP